MHLLKSIISLLILFNSTHLYAVDLTVVGKNKTLLFRQTDLIAIEQQSLGNFTVQTLTQFNLPFIGNEQGINSIFNLGSELEVISDQELKAYGWCFSINGYVAETLAHETFIKQIDSEIIWYYAYAHYQNGSWTKQCVPHGE